LHFLQATIRYCDGFRMRVVPRVDLVPEPASESLRGTNPRDGVQSVEPPDRAEWDSNFYVEVIAPSANSADPAKTAVQLQSRNDRSVRFHDLRGDPLRFLPESISSRRFLTSVAIASLLDRIAKRQPHLDYAASFGMERSTNRKYRWLRVRDLNLHRLEDVEAGRRWLPSSRCIQVQAKRLGTLASSAEFGVAVPRSAADLRRIFPLGMRAQPPDLPNTPY
jgi:hypothetical protein